MRARLEEISPSIYYFGIPFGLWVSILVFAFFSSSLTLGLYNWYNLPLFAVPSVFVFINGRLLKQTIEGLLQSLTDSFDKINEVYVMTISGMARGGKTLLGTAICYRRSQISWWKLQVKYMKMSKLRWLSEYINDEVWNARWLEVRDSYEYWISHPEYIPCLLSSIRITDKYGRYSKELHMEHLLQKERIPAYSYVFLDEAGSVVGLYFSTNKDQALINFIRWIGQFCEVHLVMTEQRSSNIAIDIREVVGAIVNVEMNKRMQATKGQMFVEWLVLQGDKHGWSPKAFNRIEKLEKWFNKVGYFAYKYHVDYGHGIETIETNMCCNLPYSYESRAFSSLYGALNKDFGEDYADCKLVYPESQMGRAISDYEGKVNE